jgi:hypothetical protein
MTSSPFTLIDDDRPVVVPAVVEDGTVHLSAAAAAAALGVPAPAVTGAGAVEIRQFAAGLDRPLALDVDARVGYLGVSAGERARALASLEAPDFTLPDLAGRPHALRDQLGKKVLLILYGSW